MNKKSGTDPFWKDMQVLGAWTDRPLSCLSSHSLSWPPIARSSSLTVQIHVRSWDNWIVNFHLSMDWVFTTASFLRTFGLGTVETKAVSLRDETIPSTRNTSSSFGKGPRWDTKKSEEKCKAFQDICKYFSEEECKSGETEKSTYVYMKNNYDTMTGLGLRPPSQPCCVLTNLHRVPWTQIRTPRVRQNEHPRKASKMQQRKQLKVSSKPKEQQCLSPRMDVNTVGIQKARGRKWLEPTS